MMTSPHFHSVVDCSIAVAETYVVHFRIRHLSYLTTGSTKYPSITVLRQHVDLRSNG